MGSYWSSDDFKDLQNMVKPRTPPSPPQPPLVESPEKPSVSFVPIEQRTYRDAVLGRLTQTVGKWRIKDKGQSEA